MTLIEFYPDIKAHPIFKKTDDSTLAKYLTCNDFYVKKYAAGEEICSPHIQNEAAGIIIKGSATVNSLNEDKNVLLRTICEGAMFGIANLYSENIGFPTRISARSSTEVLFIKKTAIKNLIESDKNTLMCFLAFQSNRIVYLNKKINSFTAGGAERRLALFLLDNAVNGIYSADVSMSALAEMLDIGRASLYRAFESLERDCCLERIDTKTIIINKDLLSEKYSDKIIHR